MTHVPIVSAIEFAKFLRSKGFELERQRGSHATYRNRDRKSSVTMAIHKGKDLRIGMFLKLLDEAGYDLDDFIHWRNS